MGKSPVITVDDILGVEGRIAARLPGYEFRNEQLEMAHAVADAMANRQHLVVEAGTGVGKSFGYLIPAILSLAESQESTTSGKRRIVVSTHTISLQEQLMTRDIPLLNSVIPLEFSAVLGKGRNNYISLRRLATAIKRADGLFSSDDEHYQLGQLKSWARETSDGSRSDLDFRILPQVWDEVQSDTSNCLGRKCGSYDDCHYFKARSRLRHADVIVVNHALFFVDLALRKMGVNLLPDYDTVILDEAHTIQDVASAHLGLSLTSGQIDFALNQLFNERTNKGLFVAHSLHAGQEMVVRCRLKKEDFFDDLAAWQGRNAGGRHPSANTTRVSQPGVIDNSLSPELMRLSRFASEHRDRFQDPGDRLDFVSTAERMEALATQLEDWRLQTLPGRVYWMESGANRYGHRRTRLLAAPINVGPELNEQLYSQVDSCIMTSATISVAGDSFDFFRNRVGLTQSRTLQLGSPFDFKSQVRLIVVSNMADPVSDKDTHERQCMDAIRRFVAESDGRAFVLCTSYRFLNRAVADLTAWMTEHSYAIYSQSAGVDRSQLLEKFRRNPRGVLFGTDSFWQGVDVKGDALSNVIIPKLPFRVPDQPLLQARLEAIRQRGGNPFNEYQLPEAIIKFKQGFGRLIRSRQDRGMVVILDPRIHTRPYGRFFIQSLPECQLETVSV